jgi:hypothetical protein
MNDQTKPETPVGRPLGDTGNGETGVPDDEQGISNRPGDRAEDDVDGETAEGDVGIPEFQRTPGKAEGEDSANPLSKPQGSQQDQEKNMESEGQLVHPPSTEAG